MTSFQVGQYSACTFNEDMMGTGAPKVRILGEPKHENSEAHWPWTGRPPSQFTPGSRYKCCNIANFISN